MAVKAKAIHRTPESQCEVSKCRDSRNMAVELQAISPGIDPPITVGGFFYVKQEMLHMGLLFLCSPQISMSSSSILNSAQPTGINTPHTCCFCMFCIFFLGQRKGRHRAGKRNRRELTQSEIDAKGIVVTSALPALYIFYREGCK